jgi:hypothetical protein
MKILRTAILLGVTGSMLAACNNDDGAVSVRKGEIDEGALTSGVTVTIAGSLGTVQVPFSEPVPEVPDATFEAELEDAVSLLVVSNQSGATADLMAGSVVASPSSPGQWSWQLNEDRDLATMTFFNETPGGLTLKAGNSYTAQFSVSVNDYIERLTTVSLGVNVTGG